NDLSFTIGVRRDRHSEAGSSTSPRVAVIYNPTKSTALKFLYGDAFRAPNVGELYYEQADFWVVSRDLKPEKIKTMEVSLKQQLSNELLGTISLYSNRMSNLIDTVSVSDDPDETLSQYQNVSKVKAKGIELELDARLKEYLRCDINYSFQYAKDADTKEDLTNSPRHIINFGLSIPILKYLFFTINSHYETDRITVYETETDPYLLTNINISTEPFFGRLKLSFLIRNLFDVEYSYPGGYEHKQPAILQDGRNFTARMEYRF
ncbi:MAG: TonB-dependent receptor, partial [Candidatus Poribacteria bacterium]